MYKFSALEKKLKSSGSGCFEWSNLSCSVQEITAKLPSQQSYVEFAHWFH